jgi:hypothetical protein
MIAFAEQDLVGIEGHCHTLGAVAPAHDRVPTACRSQRKVLESQHFFDYRVSGI